MSSAATYRNFVKLLEKWPIDPSKKGRDLGEHLRTIVSREFPQGQNSKSPAITSEEELADQLRSWQRLADNVYGRKYQRVHGEATCTGLGRDDLKTVTSTENINILAKTSKEIGIWERIKLSFI